MSYLIENYVTESGIEVISIIPNVYKQTKYDLIRADWRRQQQIKRSQERKESMNLFFVATKLIRKIRGDFLKALIR